MREQKREATINREKTPLDVEATKYFCLPIFSPTQEIVDKMADVLVTTKSTKPILFKQVEGVLRLQMPIAELMLGPTNSSGEWLMFYEPSAIQIDPATIQLPEKDVQFAEQFIGEISQPTVVDRNNFEIESDLEGTDE